MLEQEFLNILSQIERRKCEEQTLEIKAAEQGCPERLYDTFSSFSNQDDGGVILFGVDENKGFALVGVYDAQDLQKKLMEVGESMEPVVRPVLSVFDHDNKTFVTAEIPPIDIADRPCFRAGKGRIKGSYVRVGDADKPMTEYEIYSYEAFRKKIRDDIRPIEEAVVSGLDQTKLDQYILKRKTDRPNLASLPTEQVYELAGVTRENRVTLAAVMLFSPWPQAYFPQLSIIATRVPGIELGPTDSSGRRFTDSKRLDGTIPEMLEAAVGFVRSNMRIAVQIDPRSGARIDVPEYPVDAIREVLLNALVHRDYSIHTENKPIQLIMYADRMEVINPGGLYGRMTVDQLGKIQPDTRNPFLVTALESLNQTENRYSGIPRIRRAMQEAGLPAPVFDSNRNEFRVILYNGTKAEPVRVSASNQADDKKGLLAFCVVARNRKEIADYLGISSIAYATRRYIDPLVCAGKLQMTIPEKPKSRNQRYIAT